MSSKNPKLLILLRKGCQVIFPSGFVMEGLPKDQLIQLGVFANEKISVYKSFLPLDEQGLGIAIVNEEIYADIQADRKQEEKEIAKTEM